MCALAPLPAPRTHTDAPPKKNNRNERTNKIARLAELSSSPDYHVAVAEDASTGRLVGTAALIVERKFIHACGKVGHVEDVVVDAAARGQRLGQRLVEALVGVCRDKGCYKMILDCAEHNVAFYEKCGLSRKEVQMVRYLDR